MRVVAVVLVLAVVAGVVAAAPGLAQTGADGFTSIADLEGALYDCPAKTYPNGVRAELWYEVVQGKLEQYERWPSGVRNIGGIPLSGRLSRMGDAQMNTLVEISPKTLTVTSVVMGQRTPMVCTRR